jgi:hypothetical protein
MREWCAKRNRLAAARVSDRRSHHPAGHPRTSTRADHLAQGRTAACPPPSRAAARARVEPAPRRTRPYGQPSAATSVRRKPGKSTLRHPVRAGTDGIQTVRQLRADRARGRCRPRVAHSGQSHPSCWSRRRTDHHAGAVSQWPYPTLTHRRVGVWHMHQGQCSVFLGQQLDVLQRFAPYPTVRDGICANFGGGVTQRDGPSMLEQNCEYARARGYRVAGIGEQISPK